MHRPTLRLPAGRTGIAVMAVAAALIGAACHGSPSAGARSGSSLPATPTSLPTFDFAGFQHLLASLHGTPVVVNVWASWCGPCTKEAPELARAARTYRGKVQFLGVDIGDQAAPARAFIQRYGWIYPSVADPTGAIRNGLGFLGQPVTVFYDRSGTKVDAVSGAVDGSTLDAQITKILAA